MSKPPSHSEIKFVEKIYHQFIFADVEKPDTYNLAPPTFRTCSHLICLRGSYSSVTFRSTCSLLQIYFKITVLKKFAIFTGKHLCWSIFFNKVADLVKFLRTAFFVEHLRWLLLNFVWLISFSSISLVYARTNQLLSLSLSEAAANRVFCDFIKKETLAQEFSCEFYEISKKSFLTELLQPTASALSFYIFCDLATNYLQLLPAQQTVCCCLYLKSVLNEIIKQPTFTC